MIKYLLITATIIGISTVIWSLLIEPNLLIVKRYKIKSEQLKGTKIVFLSDIHASKKDNKKLKKIVKLANEQNPDMVFLGGDFVKGHKEKTSMPIHIISSHLSGLKNRYGIYSVLGNHDWYLDGNIIRKELEKNGIIVLENESIYLKEKDLYLVGLADDSMRKPDIKKAFGDTGKTKIVLSHSPDTFPDIYDNVELVLAGHTHGGQLVIPFYGPIVSNSKYGMKYLYGLIEETGNKMIVTKGVGMSVLPLRFNATPEIVVVDFE